MRTRSWALLLGAIFLILAGITLLQHLGAKPAASAAVYADGVLVRSIELSVDGSYRVESAEGWTELTVQDGRLAVTAASCPDGDCVRCGWKQSNPPIVCLPNRISIRFSQQGSLDGVVR
jgi:hypothetical protein